MFQSAGQFRQRFGADGGRELRFDAVEFAVGFYNLRNVRPLALQQKENAGQAIEQFAGEDAGRFLAGMQVFVQHQQVVAEIEEGFARTLVGQGGAANVKYTGSRARPYTVSHELESPAQINFFHVGEKRKIQAGGAFPSFALDE